MLFGHRETGLPHSDNCSGASDPHAILGVICSHLLNASRAAGTGSIEGSDILTMFRIYLGFHC